jgi:hypothetical protein
VRIARTFVLGIVWLNGCGDDTAAVQDETGDGDGTSSSSSSTSATADESESTAPNPADTSTSITEASSSSTEPAVPELEYARGIRLTRLVANQGMQIDLTVDGVDVDPAEYPVRFITGRRTLVRAFWSLHADFTPRELVGRLVVGYPDGAERVHDVPAMVEGVSEDAGPSFQWLLEPDEVRPGLTLRAWALEPDPSLATGELSSPPPIQPYSGSIELPLVDAPLEIEVVLIPVLHQLDDCEMVPMPTDEDVEAMRNDLEQNNAVQQAIVTVGEPMPYTDPIGNQDMGFSPMLAALAMRRGEDAPAPNVYYYGLLDSCDGFPSGLLGQALGIVDEATMEVANTRVSTGRWLGSGAAAAETFVHEIGHSQGRRHITCSGGEGGPENDYPHDNGRIGNWGFGIHDLTLRPPTKARDYMTYCSNEFVSDYGWEKTLDRIEILTSWNYREHPSQPPTGRVLMGIVHGKGKSVWWTSPSDGVPVGDDARIVWTIDGMEYVRAAKRQPMPDDAGVLVISALPDGADDATAVRLEVDGEPAHVFAPSSVSPRDSD